MFAFDAGLAATVFVATDIDDLLLLVAFFATRRLSTRAIVTGQFAGIALLVLVSAAAALLTVTFPPEVVALLGLIPLGMGLVALLKLRRDDDDDDEIDEGIEAEQKLEGRLH